MLALYPMFTDHMVLQRDCSNRIFGTDRPGEKVTLLFRSDVYVTKADSDGKWEIILKAYEYGGPFRMLIQGSVRVELSDILIGDVYLLSGQSNMELRMMDILDDHIPTDWNKEEEYIRHFRLEPNFLFQETDARNSASVHSVGWQRAGKEEIKQFSAAGLSFAREIGLHNDIPIGLVNIAVGGSPLEAWMPSGILEQYGNYAETVQPYLNEGMLNKTINEQTEEKRVWEEELVSEERPVSKEWKEYNVPQMLTDYYQEGYTGSLWFEKDFYLDEEPEEDASLQLGLIIDRDFVWVNDVYVGMNEHRYLMREYSVPKQILHKGTNTIRIRIVVENLNGGIVPEKDCQISVGDHKISLIGIWRYCEGIRKERTAPEVLFPPLLPMGLYYGMLLFVKELQFKAVLWYQGESNAGHEEDYCEMFHAMKKEWEKLFGRTLRFCCVQLACYQDPMFMKEDTGWGMIREYQRRCTFYPKTSNDGAEDTEAYCGLVTAIDIGERFDLHPHNKQEVGRRLALWALHFIYGEKIEYRGPVCIGYEKKEGKAVLRFSHDDAADMPLSGFEISYDGIGFESVKAEHHSKVHEGSSRMENNKPGLGECEVILDIPETEGKSVKAVRYAWNDYPGHIDFYNTAGLPAESFLLELK